MPAANIVEAMDALVAVHRTLNEQAERKTEVLKNGDMQGLESLLKEEEATAAQLKSLEDRRERDVNEFLREKGITSDDPLTVSQIAELAPQHEKEEMYRLRDELLAEIVDLKRQNALNQSLIEQSLHFIDVSLNMARPPELESVTYNHPNHTGNERLNRQSLFDSQA